MRRLLLLALLACTPQPEPAPPGTDTLPPQPPPDTTVPDSMLMIDSVGGEGAGDSVDHQESSAFMLASFGSPVVKNLRVTTRRTATNLWIIGTWQADGAPDSMYTRLSTGAWDTFPAYAVTHRLRGSVRRDSFSIHPPSSGKTRTGSFGVRQKRRNAWLAKSWSYTEPAEDTIPVGIVARMADSLVSSVSVQTHLEYGTYSNFTMIKSKLCGLGVRSIRQQSTSQSAVHAKFRELYDDCGIQLVAGCWPIGTNYTSAAHCISRANAIGAARIRAFDGWNEVPNRDNISGSWTDAFKKWQQTQWNTYNGDATWRDKPIFSNTVALAPQASQLYNEQGNLSDWFDNGNMHSYPMQSPSGMPEEYGNWINIWTQIATPKKLIVTETGYHNAMQSSTNPVNEATAAKYLGRLIVDAFLDKKIDYTNLYELYDQGVSTTDREKNWGMVRNNGTNKPSYETVKNTLALLSDSGAAFTPSALDYTVSDALGTTKHYLMQKRDKSFWLAIWQARSSWDKAARKEIQVPSDEVTINVGTSRTFTRYRPTVGTSPQDTQSGTSYTMQVLDEVQFIKIASQ